MARKISEQYHMLSAKALQLRESTGKLTDKFTEALLVEADRELADMPAETEGFNVVGFFSALISAQDLRGS